VTLISPESAFDWSAAPVPEKLRLPLTLASVSLNSERLPVVGGVMPNPPELSSLLPADFDAAVFSTSRMLSGSPMRRAR
jgi:hypothetical protein